MRKRRFMAAGGVLLLAGAMLQVPCKRPGPATPAKPAAPLVEAKEGNMEADAGNRLPETGSPDAMSDIRREFRRGDFDCKMIPAAMSAGPARPPTIAAALEELQASVDIMRVPVCQASIAILALDGCANVPRLPPVMQRISRKIEDARKSGDIEQLMEIVRHFDSLGLEWWEPSQGGLFYAQLDIEVQARFGKSALRPEPRCMETLSHATAIQDQAVLSIAIWLMQNPERAGDTLDRLPTTQFKSVMHTATLLLLRAPDQLVISPANAEIFFEVLSPQLQKEFIGAIREHLAAIHDMQGGISPKTQALIAVWRELTVSDELRRIFEAAGSSRQPRLEEEQETGDSADGEAPQTTEAGPEEDPDDARIRPSGSQADDKDEEEEEENVEDEAGGE